MGISRFRSEELREIAFGSIVAGYAVIDSAFENPISKIYVLNNTDALLTFSFQGTTEDHFVLPSLGFLLLDITLEASNPDYLPTGSALYVKRNGIPTAGSVYLTAFYGRNR